MSWFENAADTGAVAQERLKLDMAERISEAMEERGVSQAELAARLGVSAAEVSMRLRGTRNLTIGTVAAMLDALGYDLHPELRDRRVKDWSALTATGDVRVAWVQAATGMLNSPQPPAWTAVSTTTVVGVGMINSYDLRAFPWSREEGGEEPDKSSGWVTADLTRGWSSTRTRWNVRVMKRGTTSR